MHSESADASIEYYLKNSIEGHLKGSSTIPTDPMPSVIERAERDAKGAMYLIAEYAWKLAINLHEKCYTEVTEAIGNHAEVVE